MNKEIKFEPKKGFNQSSKIIAFKLGIKASIVLSNLIYKHNYWFNENKLTKIDDEYYFFITYSNLEAETSIKLSGIKGAIKALKDAGLINVKRKSVPAKNHYNINEEALINFESKYEGEYILRIEELNSNSKIERERFNQHNNIKIERNNYLSESSRNIEASEEELIKQLKESMS